MVPRATSRNPHFHCSNKTTSNICWPAYFDDDDDDDDDASSCPAAADDTHRWRPIRLRRACSPLEATCPWFLCVCRPRDDDGGDGVGANALETRPTDASSPRLVCSTGSVHPCSRTRTSPTKPPCLCPATLGDGNVWHCDSWKNHDETFRSKRIYTPIIDFRIIRGAEE